MIRALLTAMVLSLFLVHPMAQAQFEWNVLADFEVSRAGEKSHYYYNEIDKDHLDWRLGMSRFDLLGQWTPDSNWSLHARFLLERDKGQDLSKFSTPQINLQWLANNRRIGVTLGLFTNPFGSFNDKQLSTQRTFIGLPLAYAYYVNVSQKIGYLPGMGDVTKVPVDGDVQWGSSTLYYGGYTAGAMFSWNIKPAKVNWKIALVNGASNKLKRFTKPVNLGVISRLKLQPTYYWEQGISFSHGSFMQDSEVSAQLDELNNFTQTLIGTDFRIGRGFFEFSGEVIGAFYKLPQFNSETMSFDRGANDPVKVRSLGAYLDIRYEFAKIQGSYLAYRIDHLGFGELESGSMQHWDNRALRHSLAVGYHISRHILARCSVSTQQVNDKPWDKTQRTIRFVLTVHY
ncbi:MAG: hypothetical protein R3330_04545 [Saprospiraceae bacterium]|nr:hypothetical protein [Saprospiraceae bacterium]